jgi:hypothetical protein
MKQLSTLFITVFLVTTLTQRLKAQINNQDSLALVDLYKTTGGANWTNHTNWLTTAPVSSWYGITLDGSNRVYKIIISKNNLSGALPSSLGNLTNLNSLDFRDNTLISSIPNSFGNFINIQSLYLSRNKLTGAIPSTFGNLSSLQILYLSSNQLTDTIPSQLGSLVNLQKLDLGVNKFSGNIPLSFANLTSLVDFWVESNQLVGNIPDIFSNLTNMNFLNFSSNKFSGNIPASIGNLTSLTYLAFADNQLSGTIPDFICNLINLQSFYLSYNQFSGSLPGSLGNLNAMQYLYLDNNQLSGSIPVSIGNLTNVLYLFLYNNKLNGSIPATIGNKPSLVSIDFSQNKLTGSIPTSIGTLTALKYFNLSNNKLIGSIPQSINSLTKLKSLYLNNNQLSGAIPPLTNLINLQQINIAQNQFTFDGMEAIANPNFADSSKYYSPQAIIAINQNGNVLSVSVGGTPNNNSYNWYQDGSLVATKVGDSSYTVTSNAQYNVVVTNAVATTLILYSNTITISNLPIKSITLQAKESNNQVQLLWQTIGEFNTTLFAIQHSTDGKTFADIDTKAAIGIGNNNYDLIDNSPANGINYYRIKSLDKLGSISFSETVSIQLSTNYNQLKLYPNPSTDRIKINGSHISSISISNSLGKIVFTSQLNDAVNPSIPVSRFAVGTYFLHIKTTMGKENVLEFIKQ